MADLENAAAQALDAVRATLGAADEGRMLLATLREKLLRASDRFEADWAAVTDRARAFLDQADQQEKDLLAARSETEQSLDQLQAGLDSLVQESSGESDRTQAAFAELEAEGEEVPATLEADMHAAEEARRGLESRLTGLEEELQQALGEAEVMLRDVFTAQVRQLETEVEHATERLRGHLAGECVPAVAARSEELFRQLVQLEEDVRILFEGSAEKAEGETDQVLRACNDAYEDALSDVGRLESALQDLLERLRDFIDDGRERVEDRKELWDDGIRHAQQGLRDAREAVRDVEEILSRYNFVRF